MNYFIFFHWIVVSYLFSEYSKIEENQNKVSNLFMLVITSLTLITLKLKL